MRLNNTWVLGCGLAALTWTSSPLAATGRADLEKWCTHGTVAASGTCFGYLLAAQDALTAHRVEGARACLPAKIELAEKHRIVLEWLRANPNDQEGSAFDLVVRAFAARYPCAAP